MKTFQAIKYLQSKDAQLQSGIAEGPTREFSETENFYPLDTEKIGKLNREEPESLSEIASRVREMLAKEGQGLIWGQRLDPGRITGELDGTQIWDFLAWYQPLHSFGEDWGIYVTQSGILKIADEISAFCSGPPPRDFEALLVLAAYECLLQHEYFHYKVESFGIRLSLADRCNPRRWIDYKARVYRPTLGSDSNLEEAMANAFSYKIINSSRGSLMKILGDKMSDSTARWMYSSWSTAPPGYRKADKYLGKEFVDGCHELMNQIVTANKTHTEDNSDWVGSLNLINPLVSIKHRIFVVVDGPSRSFLPELDAFANSLSSARKFLRENEFEYYGSGKGDHEKFKNHKLGLVLGLDGTANFLDYKILNQWSKTLGIPQKQLEQDIRRKERVVDRVKSMAGTK